MKQDKTFLGTEPIGRLLLKLAVPTVVAQLVNMLYNIVDRIYIGHMPATQPCAHGRRRLPAADNDNFGVRGADKLRRAPRASIAMGKGDHATAEKILGGCFSLQIIISIILTA